MILICSPIKPLLTRGYPGGAIQLGGSKAMTQKNVNGLMLKSFSRSLVSLCLHRHASYQEVDLAGVVGGELGVYLLLV